MRIFLSLVAEHEQFIKTMESKTRPNEEDLKTYIEPQGRIQIFDKIFIIKRIN